GHEEYRAARRQRDLPPVLTLAPAHPLTLLLCFPSLHWQLYCQYDGKVRSPQPGHALCRDSRVRLHPAGEHPAATKPLKPVPIPKVSSVVGTSQYTRKRLKELDRTVTELARPGAATCCRRPSSSSTFSTECSWPHSSYRRPCRCRWQNAGRRCTWMTRSGGT